MDLIVTSYIPLTVAAFCIGLSKGGLPGIAMLAVPLLALSFSPIQAAALLLPIFILSDAVAVYLYRHQFDRTNLKTLIPAGLLGVLIGGLTASLVSDAVVALFIGLLGVCFCLNVWLRKPKHDRPKQPTVAGGWFWGTLSGFTSFVAHAGGPPYQIYTLPQKMPRIVFAGTTTILFACVNLAKVVPYALIEPFTKSALITSMMVLPVALLGTVVGKYGVHKLSDVWFYRCVQVALFVICLRLTIQSMPLVFGPLAVVD